MGAQTGATGVCRGGRYGADALCPDQAPVLVVVIAMVGVSGHRGVDVADLAAHRRDGIDQGDALGEHEQDPAQHVAIILGKACFVSLVQSEAPPGRRAVGQRTCETGLS
jgi:hypothetical protein